MPAQSPGADAIDGTFRLKRVELVFHLLVVVGNLNVGMVGTPPVETRENAHNPLTIAFGTLALLGSLLGGILLFRRRKARIDA